MFGFVFMLLVGLVGLVCIGAAIGVHRNLKAKPASTDRYGSNDDVRPLARVVLAIAGPVLMVVSALVIVFSSLVSVPTHSIAIVTFGGRPTGTPLSNGYHWVPMWDSTVVLDNQVQTDVFEGNCQPTSGHLAGIPVRIAGEQTACAQVRIVWQMRQPAGSNLYRNYSTQQNVRTKLVESELLTAMNQQFDTFDPIGSLNSKFALGSPQNPTVPDVAKLVTKQMQAEIGSRIQVTSVLVPIINYDGAVQTQLNRVLQQKAATDVAIQAEQTATAQRTAADTLAGAKLTPAVLAQTCYNLVSEAMKVGYTLPPSFNCTGGSSGLILAPSH